jgi:hypothetical protein
MYKHILLLLVSGHNKSHSPNEGHRMAIYVACS